MIGKLCRRAVTAALTAWPALASSSLGAQAPQSTPAADTSYVEYGEPWISLPLGIGLRVPQYDRVDGVVLPWGPAISLAQDRIRIDPTITYRSHIGKIDPFVLVTARAKNGLALELAGGRGTFTNDAWIRPNLVNTLAALAVGSDSRNYFRADRGWALVSKQLGYPGILITPSVGVRFENDWSTGVPFRHTNAPWSAFSKADTLKMRRTNPPIDKGHVSSALGRLLAEYDQGGVKGSFDGLVEQAFNSQLRNAISDESSGDTGSFTQVTLHGVVGFPTFATQRFDFRGHVVVSSDLAPRQRFVYLGGAGTLATVDLLALGGNRLFFAEGTYSIPINRIVVPVIGSPIVGVRYAAGSAGVGDWGDFIQNLGVQLGVPLIKVEYDIDPNYKRTSFTHKHALSVSLELPAF
jgi:hypothetical protein